MCSAKFAHSCATAQPLLTTDGLCVSVCVSVPGTPSGDLR